MLCERHVNFINYLIKDAIYFAIKGDSETESIEASEWLFSHDTEAGSFNWYCNLIGINPDKIRRKLFESKIML